MIAVYALFFRPFTPIGLAAALTFLLIFCTYISFRERPMAIRLGVLVVCWLVPVITVGYWFWRLALRVKRAIDRDAAANGERRVKPE